jgi:hypothetical protein
VTFAQDHKIWKHIEPGWLLLRMTLLDPAASLKTDTVLDEAISEIRKVMKCIQEDQIQNLVSPFIRAATCAIEADVRWLRANLTANVETTASRLSENGWERVSDEVISALVNPGDGLPQCFNAGNQDIKEDAKNELARLRSSAANGSQVWAKELPSFHYELFKRKQVIFEEAQDAIDLRHRELNRAEVAFNDAVERGNRAQITRAENLRDTALDVYEMTKVYWKSREAWLLATEEVLETLLPKETLRTLIHAKLPS